MLKLPNYQNIAEIYLSDNTVIYKGIWKPEQQPVSPFGADLEFCLTQLQATGKIPNFTLGTQDLSGQLLIPQKLSHH